MRALIATTVVALVFPASAATILPPVNDYGGGAGSTCRWNPYAVLTYEAGRWFWIGRFEWYDPPGNPTGIPCV